MTKDKSVVWLIRRYFALTIVLGIVMIITIFIFNSRINKLSYAQEHMMDGWLQHCYKYENITKPNPNFNFEECCQSIDTFIDGKLMSYLMCTTWDVDKYDSLTIGNTTINPECMEEDMYISEQVCTEMILVKWL